MFKKLKFAINRKKSRKRIKRLIRAFANGEIDEPHLMYQKFVHFVKYGEVLKL